MKRLLILALCLVLAAGCAPATPAAVVVPSPTIAPATQTPEPATPTATSAPTETPLPTATFTPTATPVPQVISSGNASKLTLVRRYGEGQVEQVRWSPDGKQLLALTSVYLKLFDPATGNAVWEMETGPAQVEAAFNPDGKTITTITRNGAISNWDAATGKLLAPATEQQEMAEFHSLSRSGKRVAVLSSRKETTVIDTATGKQVASNNGAAIPMGAAGVVIAPDDATFWTSGFGSGNSQQIQRWEVSSGKFLGGLKGATQLYLTEMAMSADSKLIAGVSRLRLTADVDFALMVWDAQSGNLLYSIKTDKEITSYALMPAANTALVAGSNGSITVFDYNTGTKGSVFGDFDTYVLSMDVSADGKQVAAFCADGTIKIYDITTRKMSKVITQKVSSLTEPYVLSGMNYIVRDPRKTGMGVSPDGKYVAIPSADRKSIALVDPYTLEVIRNVGNDAMRLSTIAVSPDGSLLAGVDLANRIYVWDSAKGIQKQSITPDHKNYIKSLTFSPDNKLLASLSGGRLGELYVWDVATGKKVKTLSGQNGMSLSPDGRTMFSDNVDLGVYVWDMATGKKLASPQADWLYDLSYSPDGKIVAMAGTEMHKEITKLNQLITLMDTTTYKMLPLQLNGHPAILQTVGWSPDSKLVVTSDINGNVRLWDAQSGEMLKQLDTAAPAPLTLGFLPGNTTLVVGSGDGALRFYEVE